ncbi:MAG: hypothetical protein RJA36_3499 [Pseudomonadota bacterium]
MPCPFCLPSLPLLKQAGHDFGLILLSFLLYWTAYQWHELIVPYVAYAQGVDLLFVPAGVKLVMILVAGWRGALGCGLALLAVAPDFWPDQTLPVLTGYVALSIGVTWLVLDLLLSRRRLGPALEGLRFWDIVRIDALNTLLHGIVVNLYFWTQGLRSADMLWSATLAMALGDFLGTGVVMLVVLLVAQLLLPEQR